MKTQHSQKKTNKQKNVMTEQNLWSLSLDMSPLQPLQIATFSD